MVSVALTFRPKIAALCLGLVLLAALVTAARYWSWYRSQPPAETGRGVIRLTHHDPRGPAPRTRVQLANGSRVVVAFDGIDDREGRPVGHVLLRSPEGRTGTLDLQEGDRRSMDGVSVEAVRLWEMPDPGNDAIDLRVAAAVT
jgi:hypothetical protein